MFDVTQLFTTFISDIDVNIQLNKKFAVNTNTGKIVNNQIETNKF